MNDGGDVLKALCTEPENYSEAGLQAIEEFAELDARPVSSTELETLIGKYDLLFVRLKTFVDSDALRSAKRLKAIASPTTGLNHIDLDAAEARGVALFHLKGQTDLLRTVTSTAEHTFALLLALYRNIPAAVSDVLDGNWRQDEHRGRELQGKRLGILGFGRLGRIVAGYGKAFGMQVTAFDHNFENAPEYLEISSSLEELARKADVFSIHIPLNAQTLGLIGSRAIGLLPSGAVLINTSRGEIVDEAALIEAIESGRLAGAAVDVVNDESHVETNRLIDYAKTHANVIVTPHIGGATVEAVEKTDLFVIKRLRNWLREHG